MCHTDHRSRPRERVHLSPKRKRRAESYSRAANYRKASAGRKAVERILDGENWEKAVSDMEAEWKEAVSEHMWD